jgi:hypothetical protein
VADDGPSERGPSHLTPRRYPWIRIRKDRCADDSMSQRFFSLILRREGDYAVALARSCNGDDDDAASCLFVRQCLPR